MDNKKTFETLDDNTFRIDKILFLAGMTPGSMCDELQEFFEDEDDDSLAKIFDVKFPEWMKEAFDTRDFDEISGWLYEQGKLGFVVRVATPVMENGSSYSWGYMRTDWIYADTLEDAIEKGVAWAANERKRESEKNSKKAKGK